MRNRPYGFKIYLVNIKTIRKIAQNFVAFSKKLSLNFLVFFLVFRESFEACWRVSYLKPALQCCVIKKAKSTIDIKSRNTYHVIM